MSFSRENITWQSRDGTWSLGFYATVWVGSENPEWDVEYDFGRFHWVSTGHATEQKAQASWKGVNPGGGIGPVPYKGYSKECKEYDGMARDCKERVRREEAEYRKMYGTRDVYGRPRHY